MMGTGRIIPLRDMERYCFRMVNISKERLRRVKHMEKESIYLRMGTFSKDKYKITKLMAKEFILEV